MTHFGTDDFELLGVPRRFALDRVVLDERRRALQAEVHPDRHVGADAAARRLAMQWAVRVNEAHGRLADPLKRAAYLCERAGTPVGAEDNTAMPEDFLMRQMAWRESLAAAGSPAEIDRLAAEVDGERRASHARLEDAIDREHDFARAAREVRALMFIERFADDVGDRVAASES